MMERKGTYDMQMLDWRICSSCKDSCRYCFASEKLPAVGLDQERIILDKIKNSNIEAVNITGGEPLIDAERCFRIIDSLHHSGKSVYLSTNGYQVLEYLTHIRETVSLLGLPLDGPDEESNMACGRNRGSFGQVLQILESHAAKDIPIKIGTVVTKKNLSCRNLEGLAELMDHHPVNIWRIYEMLPENRAIQNRADLELAPKDLEELIHIVRRISEKKHRWHVELVTRRMRNANYMIIRPNGTVIIPIDDGNQVDEVLLGSLLDMSLPELIEKWNKVARERNDIFYSKRRLSDLGFNTLEVKG